MQKDQEMLFQNTEIAFAYKSNSELKNAHFVFSTTQYPMLINIGTGMIKTALALRLPVKFAVKKTVFNHFCGGETLEDCHITSKKLDKYNVKTILDYSVEGAKDEEGFEQTTLEILKTIEKAPVAPANPFCVFKPTGIASTELLEKMQLGKSLDPDEQQDLANVKLRFETICKAAYQAGVRILVDAEESWYQDVVDEIVYENMAMFNKERAIVFNTFQMYKHRSYNNLVGIVNKAKEEGFYVGAKLVRGAYMEKERERAEEHNYADPIQPDKESTDSAYNDALAFCLDHIDMMEVFSGSHNEYSNRYLAELVEKKGIDHQDPRIWFSQLYGMSDHISFNLAKRGYNVAKYLPFGPVSSVMPYLFRRAEENTSIAGQTNKELELIRKELQRRRKSRR